MIDAREILRSLRIPQEDEVEVRRIGSEIAALFRSPKFDGRPITIDIPAGTNDEERDRSYRIACEIQRRFQASYWMVYLEGLNDAFGPRVHRLHFAIDPMAGRQPLREEPNGKQANGHGLSFSLRALHDELSSVFGHQSAAPPVLPAQPVLSIVFGTYNRLSHLQKAIESVRKSIAGSDLAFAYEIVVCDGGSTDGSRAWLASQPDVILVGERRLEGAVKAFNQCFSISRGEFVANLNDDSAVRGAALAEGVAYLQAHPKCGQVAFSFSGKGQPKRTVNDIYPPKDHPKVTWGTTYANFGITHHAVAEKVAYIQGGFWNPVYKTYAGDCELSAWIWKLGFTVDKLPHLYVEDCWVEDDLRERNVVGSAAEAKRMYSRWPAEAFLPDGRDPRVSPEEIARFRAVKGSGEPSLPDAPEANRLPPPAIAARSDPPDLATEMASLLGFPEPAEERRLRSIAQRIRALDPVDERFPPRAERLSSERVLHVSLGTDADPQAGQVRALRKLGREAYREIRWFADWREDHGERQKAILQAAAELLPSLVFMQLQTDGVLDLETVREIRRLVPEVIVVTWSGDIASENSPWNVDWQVPLGRVVDLTLHSSMSHVRALRAAGIHNAGYLQIGYDEEQYRTLREAQLAHVGSQEAFNTLDKIQQITFDYDVSFLGSHYGGDDAFSRSVKWHDGALRDEVVGKMRAAFGPRFGLFGSGWGEGVPKVPLQRAHEVYWRSKMGLSISLMNDLECYSSDRLHRILGSGALALVKRFPGMSTWGLKHGESCLVWDTADEAVALATKYAADEKGCTEIAAAGAKLAREHLTWDARMLELVPYLEAVRAARESDR